MEFLSLFFPSTGQTRELEYSSASVAAVALTRNSDDNPWLNLHYGKSPMRTPSLRSPREPRGPRATSTKRADVGSRGAGHRLSQRIFSKTNCCFNEVVSKCATAVALAHFETGRKLV